MGKEISMLKLIDVICTNCPMGCKIMLSIDKKTEEVLNIEGNKCKQGERYALDEFKNPVRVLTATVRTTSVKNPLLPVRISKPIPKDKMKEMMYLFAKIIVKQPLKVGQVVEPNVMDMDVDLIATTDLSEW